jgi:uncharacterized protein (TIGR02391 family)
MTTLESVQTSTQQFAEETQPILYELSQQAQKLAIACETVGRSWSHSFAGYHGRLYYSRFEPPPMGHFFSPERGGIDGIPNGWRERSAEEVKAEIERLAGVSIDELEKINAQIRERANDLRADVLDQIAAVPTNSRSDRDNRLLADIDQLRFGTDKTEYVKANMPNGLMTRDLNALMQGMCVPSHLYYEGVAHEATTTCEALSEFIKLLGRLTRSFERAAQPQGQTPSIPLSTLHSEILSKCQKLYEDGSYAEAAERGFKVVRDRLRQLTGHEKGADAFGKGKLHIKGAAAQHVDADFNEAVKFLTMAIDRFRNEKSHTSDAKIEDPMRAYEYLRLSSLALNLLEGAEILASQA